MFTRNIATSVAVTSCVANTVVNTASNTLTGTAVDMKGLQSVTFIMVTPAQAAAATPVLSAVYGNTSSPATAIANSSCVAGLNTTIQILEIERPTLRYVAPYVTLGTTNTMVNIIAIQTGRDVPEANMVVQNSSFNTTTGTFSGVANTQSATNTPTSIVIVANP